MNILLPSFPFTFLLVPLQLPLLVHQAVTVVVYLCTAPACVLGKELALVAVALGQVRDGALGEHALRPTCAQVPT